MPSNEIVQDMLSNHPKKRNRALEIVYKECFPLVKVFILKNSGNLEDAKDMFQDAIAIVYNNLQRGAFRAESSVKSYTFSIAKNLWLMKLRKKEIQTSPLEDQGHTANGHSDQLNSALIHQVIQSLNEGCRRLLTSFYFESKTMAEIANNFGLGSIQAAKTKKLRCMTKLHEVIKKFDLNPEHFII